MRKIIFMFLMVPAFASADDGNINIQTQKPQQLRASYAFKDGYPTVVFSDGREARVVQGLGEKIRPYAKLKQIENTCSPKTKMATCKMHLDIAKMYFGVRWSIHPDPNKLNKVLELTSTFFSSSDSPQKEVLESMSNNILFKFDSDQLGLYKSEFADDTLECDSAEWLTDIPVQNGNYVIDSWASEVMDGNMETKLNENQTQSAAYGLNLIPLGSNSFKMGSMISSFAKEKFFPPFVSAQVNNISFVSTSGKFCQVVFESSIEDAAKQAFNLKDEVRPETIQAFQYNIKSFEFPVGISLKNMIHWKENNTTSWTVE